MANLVSLYAKKLILTFAQVALLLHNSSYFVVYVVYLIILWIICLYMYNVDDILNF